MKKEGKFFMILLVLFIFISPSVLASSAYCRHIPDKVATLIRVQDSWEHKTVSYNEFTTMAFYISYPISHYCPNGGKFEIGSENHLAIARCNDDTSKSFDCSRLASTPFIDAKKCVFAKIEDNGNSFTCRYVTPGKTCTINNVQGKCYAGKCCVRVGDMDDYYHSGYVVYGSDEDFRKREDSCVVNNPLSPRLADQNYCSCFGYPRKDGSDNLLCPDTCQNGNCVNGNGNNTPGNGNETPGNGNNTPGNGNETPGNGNETPGGNQTDLCFNEGETRCIGLELQECKDGGGFLTWITIEEGSKQCCNGDWLENAPDPCCGNDNESDLGNKFEDYLCVNDGSYHWLKGEECNRYLTNHLLFSSHQWYFCINNSNYKVNSKEACSRECDFFCNIQDDTWTSDNEYTLLSESLSTDETVDTLKSSLNSTEACCPSQWCYDGSMCIENQIDEACDSYVYNYNNETNRCLDGSWQAREKQYSWKDGNYGYCPNATDCFVSCGNYTSNYQPDTYFTDQKPQCILPNQYILDNYCNSSKWGSRTGLIATKLIQIAGDSNFAIHCDNYANLLNDYNYLVDSKPVTDYLTNKCHVGNEIVPCTNNFCVMENLDTKQIFFSTSLNQPLFSGFNKVLNLNTCTGGNTDAWSYSSCNGNILYNEFLKSIIYSNDTIPDVTSTNAFDTFLQIVKHPIMSLKTLINHGTIFYVEEPSKIKLDFPLLNETPRFDRLYLLRNANQHISSTLETDKFDTVKNQTFDNLLAIYSGFSYNICQPITDFTIQSNITHSTCYKKDGTYYVAEYSTSLSNLMLHWLDLTSKLKIWHSS